MDWGLRMLISIFYGLNKNVARRPGWEGLLDEMCTYEKGMSTSLSLGK